MSAEFLTAALRNAAARYPKMQPTDAVKLLYQAAFGSGHLVRDESYCRCRIEKEWENIAPYDAPVELFGRYARLPLARAKADDISSATVARMFADAARVPGDKTDFDASLVLLEELTAAGGMPFSSEALRTYLAAYRAAGEPAVSHSDTYHAAYAPAYRLITAETARLLPVVSAIESALREREHVTVAIDGRCASGKTTAAGILARLFDGAVVHLDDFFLPPEKRTAKRLAEPGGNIDYERILGEIVPHAKSSAGFAYRAFDCRTGSFREEPVSVPPSRLLIVEGSYALHPALGSYADITVYSDVSAEEQLARIAARGDDIAVFRSRWIPLEEKYAAGIDARRRAAIVLP